MSDVSAVATSARSLLQSNGAKTPSELADMLGRIAPALETAVGAGSSLVTRLRLLLGRLAHERLQIAVLGQFKRGKSTFINALLGVPVLPAAVIPLTAIATFVAWGGEPRIVVAFKDGSSREFDVQPIDEIRSTLFRFIAEEANPENRLGVARVDLFFPANILVDGTVIIDTPGIGSTFRYNTETTMQVLAEGDAAFFVVSADPPITEVEIEFLRRVKSKIACIFFILNKADYLRADEQRVAADFLQKVLSEKALIDAGDKIFCMSARNGLEAKQNGDDAAQQASGVASLEDHVVRALANRKRRWLEEAVRGKAIDLLAEASAELALRARTVQMPLDELAAKADAFRDALHAIEEERRVVHDLLAGDHRRLREALDARVVVLRGEIAAKLVGLIDECLRDAGPGAENATRAALSAAIGEAFESARELLVGAFAADASTALGASQQRVDALVDDVRRAAANIFDVPLASGAESERFVLAEDPYWVTENINTSLIPDPAWLFDRLFPASIRRRRLRSRMVAQTNEMTTRSAENLRWAIVRGLDETFRKASARFEERLDEAIEVTRNVTNDALTRRRDRSFAVEAELARLANAATALDILRKELQDGQSDSAA